MSNFNPKHNTEEALELLKQRLKQNPFAYQTCGALSNRIAKFERQLVRVCSHG